MKESSNDEEDEEEDLKWNEWSMRWEHKLTTHIDIMTR